LREAYARCHDDRVTPYRVSAVDDGIVLTLGPSTLWLRLRLNLKLVVRRFPVLAVVGLLPGVLVAFIVGVVLDGPGAHASHPSDVLVAGLAGVGGVLTLAVVIACVRSLSRSAAETGLPREISFRATTLIVRPARGAPFETNWTWIQGASVRRDDIDVVISESPHRMVHIERSKVGDANFATLSRWLDKNGRLER
jgi:hypothetical protein